MPVHIPFDNTYARLPERFFARLKPTPVAGPRLIRVNGPLAESLGIDPASLESAEGAAIFSGNTIAEGSEPIAQAYAGHQFGGFSPQLGDGRAILLGEVVGRDGLRRDIQLKGSGPTPFSRRGDGRAALGPVLREYLLSEAMAALGVPTTRALAAVTTGEMVPRETMVPGAIFTRVAASHIRVGTFQYFASQGDLEAVRLLADYAIARHYPEAAENARPYRALLDGVDRATGRSHRAMAAGRLHPRRDEYRQHGHLRRDHRLWSLRLHGRLRYAAPYSARSTTQGRYAYGNQPNIAFWNLSRLAEALLSLLGENDDAAIAEAQESLAAFAPRFQSAYDAGLRRKIGVMGNGEADTALAHDLLRVMAENGADFTLTFRSLSDADDNAARVLFTDAAAVDKWMERWQRHLAAEGSSPTERRVAMQAVNPAYIPRNHIVERVIQAGVEAGDFAPFEEFLDVLAKPYEHQPGRDSYTLPPTADERVLQTFCGT